VVEISIESGKILCLVEVSVCRSPFHTFLHLHAPVVVGVFEKEPLTENSEIWDCENLLITPHCADQDTDHCLRAMEIFGKNLERYVKDGTKNLINVIDKQLGY
jgi:phosphoglycerate dehydrogenase-like enzyme